MIIDKLINKERWIKCFFYFLVIFEKNGRKGINDEGGEEKRAFQMDSTECEWTAGEWG
jgi:hypothetical protein